MNNSLKVSSFETFGTHEGPGIRFVIFTQGCNYRCIYCHNPETQSINGGTNYSVDELIKKILRYRSYFKDNGGVTISGGEPLLQVKVLIPLFKKLRELNIHTTIDTNGSTLNQEVDNLLKYTDLVLADIKHSLRNNFQSVTGKENDNPFRFTNYLESKKIPFWIRYVLVEGYTDQAEALTELQSKISNYNYMKRIDFLPFHSLGKEKYEKLNMKYKLNGLSEYPETKVNLVNSMFKGLIY